MGSRDQTPLAKTTLVLGGARSGKSRHAEALAEHMPERVYIATAQARDDEMRQRIADHQARRGPGWTTVEAPLDLACAIVGHAAPGRALLVDCLTLWLSNLMEAGRDPVDASTNLIDALAVASGPVVLVGNEVGLGIVPDTPLGRAFRDAAGRLNQDVAAACQRVVFVAAGLPLVLKDDRP